MQLYIKLFPQAKLKSFLAQSPNKLNAIILREREKEKNN